MTPIIWALPVLRVMSDTVAALELEHQPPRTPPTSTTSSGDILDKGSSLSCLKLTDQDDSAQDDMHPYA